MDEKRFCPLCGASFVCEQKSSRVWCSKKCRDNNSAKNNRDKKNEYNRKYRASHPDGNKAAEQRYREKNKDKILERDRQRDRKRRKSMTKEQRQILYSKRDKEKERIRIKLRNASRVENLSRHYIACVLGLKVSELSENIIAIKREQLMIYRSVKQLVQTIKEKQND